jgi:hypothetical protein
VFLEIFDDERDSAIGRVVRCLAGSRLLIGETTHLRYLLVSKSRGTHNAPRGVCTINREFPIAISGEAARIRLRICVSLDGNVIRKLTHFFRERN